MPAFRAGREAAGPSEAGRVPVAIWDKSPAYRQGLAHALARAGFAVEDPNEVSGWVSRTGVRVLLSALSSDDDVARLRALEPSAETRLVVLLAEPSPWRFRTALTALACFPVARDAPVDEIVAVVSAAVEERLVLPLETARSLAATWGAAPPVPRLTPEELTWLEALASGTTVYRLANSAGYSEREMYRRLGSLYRKMGATSRVEAMVNATRWGLIPTTRRPAPASLVAARYDGHAGGSA